jgi:hypothetical protein
VISLDSSNNAYAVWQDEASGRTVLTALDQSRPERCEVPWSSVLLPKKCTNRAHRIDAGLSVTTTAVVLTSGLDQMRSAAQETPASPYNCGSEDRADGDQGCRRVGQRYEARVRRRADGGQTEGVTAG